MSLYTKERHIEAEYHVSWYIVAYKLIFGLAELVLGLAILIYGHAALARYNAYAARELLEDPHDLLVPFLESIVPGLLTHNYFLATYLILLGGAKVVGAIGLIRGKHWGVDLLVGLTAIMLPFEAVKLIISPSLPEFVYLGLGVFIALYLINFEPHRWASRMVKKVIK